LIGVLQEGILFVLTWSKGTISGISKQRNLKPHLIETCRLSRGKRFIEKLRGVLGLYLNPLDKALVHWVDQKSQTQALDCTGAALAAAGGNPARQTYDHQRNGTTTLFAALNMLDGKVIGDCMPAASSSRIDSLPTTDPGQDAARSGLASDRRQQWDSQPPSRPISAETPFSLPLAFHFRPPAPGWNMVEHWFREIEIPGYSEFLNAPLRDAEYRFEASRVMKLQPLFQEESAHAGLSESFNWERPAATNWARWPWADAALSVRLLAG
jgi:hypothetical protein